MNNIQNHTHPKGEDIKNLLALWETSVRKTHSFLTEEDIHSLKPMVWQAIETINSLYCYHDDKDGLQGFIGVDQDKIEMLFIHGRARGKGIGKQLMQYAIDILGAVYVDVNEQNEQAVGFYKHMGFNIIGRSPLDSQGNPFPLLHMKKE